MVDLAFERELRDYLAGLAPAQQRQVLEYARALHGGGPGEALLRFAGTIPAQELEAMERAVTEGCERVDADGW